MRQLPSAALFVVVGMVLLVATAFGEAAPKPQLTPEKVFAVEPLSKFWTEAYAEIEGQSLEEKECHARTTIDAKAVAEMKLYEKEKELGQIGRELLKSLPEKLRDGQEPRDRFLQTHWAWREYIGQQAQFIANTSEGGSGYTLILRGVLLDEIQWRIRLYRDLLDGKNAVKDELYFYTSGAGN